jgi:hypothetical protein
MIHYFLLLYQFNFTYSPGLIQPGLKRTIHAQGYEPGFARDSLKPVALLTGRWLGREVDIDRAVGICLQPFAVTV